MQLFLPVLLYFALISNVNNIMTESDYCDGSVGEVKLWRMFNHHVLFYDRFI
jgi:hypothetical protein